MALNYKDFENIYRKLQLLHNPLVAKVREDFLQNENRYFRHNIRDGKVLVAGSGLGHDSIELSKYNQKVIGVELLPNLLEYSRRHENSMVSFINGDIRNLPFADDSFDYSILNMGTIGNFDDKEIIIKELLRVARTFFFDFYINKEYALIKRKKMYEEEGWHNVRILGYDIISDDGLHSKHITKEDLQNIVDGLSMIMEIENLCDIAMMARISKS